MTSWIADWSALFGVSSVAALLAAGLWWVIRRRRRELRFPIARILKLPQTKLPRVVLRKPPLLPFLTFLLAAIAFALWTAKPRTQIFANHNPQQLRVHLFVDMSPSVASHVTALELARTASGLWPAIGNSSRITMSTSHSDAIYEIHSASQIEDILQGLGFHRAGVRIGTALKNQLTQTGEVDRILIVSDRDQHSWSGFQWQYLQDDAEVFLVNVDPNSDSGTKPNIFINGARRVSAPGALSMDWEVEIAQGGLQKSQEGTLKASWRGDTLATTSWKLPDGKRTMSVSISWPSTKLPATTDGEPILWEVTPQGDDALLMDNQFRTSISGRGGSAIIVAEPAGELPLEDPANGLLTVLRVIGLQAERVDVAPRVSSARPLASDARKKERQANAPADRSMMILLGGLGHGVDTFCSTEVNATHTWVVPWGEGIDHAELCDCVARLAKKSNAGCSDVHTREPWMEWLIAAGGKQLGGEIGEKKNAVAYVFSNPTEGRDIVALTVPLMPSRAFGIDYGRFPLLVRSLLSLEARDMNESGLGGVVSDNWLRENDLATAVPTEKKSDHVFASQNQFNLSNVPLGESLLAQLPTTQLPPLWTDSRAEVLRRGAGKLDSEDPVPWLRGMIIAALSALAIDLIWNMRRKRVRARAVLWAVGCSLAWGAQNAQAQVQLDYFHTPSSQSMTFTKVAREVNSRTSIELLSKPVNFETLEQAGESPWLWVRSPERMSDSKGQITAEMIRWLKRGGFLVIESSGSDDAVWDRFAKPLLTGTFKPTGWRPVPQDHELMRSFYLLETLPSCNGKIWRWFGIDGRLAILQAPYHFSDAFQDQAVRSNCDGMGNPEYQTRVFINILMVALTTDYKRDQIHLPEILKRLRSP